MGQPAAKQGDQIVATDTHIIMIPSPGGPVPTPLPHPFSGILDGNLSPNVKIMGRPAAIVGSTATNTPPHIPQGGPFQRPPGNRGTIIQGSATVRINGKGGARNGDQAMTCNDPADLPIGRVVAVGTVFIGG
ncbi:MAG: PAAR domain-containing protein [Chloroflexota bacterium]